MHYSLLFYISTSWLFVFFVFFNNLKAVMICGDITCILLAKTGILVITNVSR